MCHDRGSENHGITGEVLCMIAMSAAAAGAGAVIDNEPEVFIPGAVIGGVIGYLACGDDEPRMASQPADSDGDGAPERQEAHGSIHQVVHLILTATALQMVPIAVQARLEAPPSIVQDVSLTMITMVL